MPRVVEPRRVVEHVAQDRGDALVLVALRGEALSARVERDAEGWVVRVQAHDFADRGGREVEAGRVEQEGVEVGVSVYDVVGCVVGAFVGVCAVEVRDVGEASGVE